MSHPARPAAACTAARAADGAVEITLGWGGERRRARFAGAPDWLDPSPDAALAAALPVAMGVAGSVTAPDGTSPGLLANAERLQDLLEAWGPSLSRVEVLTGAPPSGPVPSGRGTAAFFTGGVDSFYTVLTRREEIDALVFVHGLDLPADDPKRDLVSALLDRVGEELGMPVVELESDVRPAFSDPTCDWERIYTSCALATVAHLLGERFERVLIPATHSYLDLHPTGSHPLLDPLYSSDRVRIEHVDALSRVAKIERLSESRLAMSNLRVCFQPGVPTLNCGQCPKCMRTMAGLRVVGALGRCETLPAHLSLRVMSSGRVRSRRSLTYVRENLAALEARGTDPYLTLALRRLIARGARYEAWEKSRQLADTARWAGRTKLGAAARRLGLRR